MKYLLIFSLFILSCSHKKVKENPVPSEIKEVQAVSFYPPSFSGFSGETCREEQVETLMEKPKFLLSGLIEIYAIYMDSNNSFEIVLNKLVELKKKEETEETYKKILDLNISLKEKLEKTNMISQKYSQEYIINTLHDIYEAKNECKDFYKKVMTSKEIDNNGNSCEYRTSLLYIEDPYEIFKEVLTGIQIEMTFNKVLFEVYSIHSFGQDEPWEKLVEKYNTSLGRTLMRQKREEVLKILEELEEKTRTCK